MSTPHCFYFENQLCRSCDLMSMGLPRSVDFKVNAAKNALVASVPLAQWEEPVSLKKPFQSRSKAKLVVGGTTENPKLGIFNEALDVSELEACPLHIAVLNEIVLFIKEEIRALKLHPYDPKNRIGELKAIILVSNRDASEILVRFILRSLDLKKRIEALLPKLQNKFSSIKVVSINLQPVHHAILEGKEEIVLTDQKYILETLNDVSLLHAPQSFSQVTPEIAEALYRSGAVFLKEASVKSAVDLFCGNGSFLLTAARCGITGEGIEISDQSVEAATVAATKNGCSGISFRQGDLLKVISPVELGEDAVIVNPPRRGLGSTVLNAVKQSSARILLYSSCNPDSLNRDLIQLRNEFKPIRIKAFDMFPLTQHLEVLCLLERVSR